MNYWYFKFEGQFKEGSPEYGCKGVFSSCLIPEGSYTKARSLFLRALEKNGIDLSEVLECFEVDGDALDPQDEQNTFWIDWYNKAQKERAPVFDKWHVFDD